MWLLLGLPRKSTSGSLVEPLEGGDAPSLGAKLLCETQARANVPSTGKCSEDNTLFGRARSRTRLNSSRQTSCSISRPRFFDDVACDIMGTVIQKKVHQIGESQRTAIPCLIAKMVFVVVARSLRSIIGYFEKNTLRTYA